MEQEFPNIEDIEDVYVAKLEEGNTTDTTKVEYLDTQHSNKYGRFTEQEVRGCLKELNRNTTAGVDGIRTPDISN